MKLSRSVRPGLAEGEMGDKLFDLFVGLHRRAWRHFTEIRTIRVLLDGRSLSHLTQIFECLDSRLDIGCRMGKLGSKECNVSLSHYILQQRELTPRLMAGPSPGELLCKVTFPREVGAMTPAVRDINVSLTQGG